MAGGSGTRFWPLSRRAIPKQFLALAGPKSLLRETFERLAPIVGAERVWVVAGEAHIRRVREELPEVPAANVLGEPVGRNTAPCIGLAAHRILRRDPAAKVLVCPSDHIVRPARAFAEALGAAVQLLDGLDRPDAPWSVTFGIPPRYPATGFGYIERGEPIPLGGAGPVAAFRIARFKEKPPEEVARRYVESGRYYWNSGIFLWTAAGVLRLIEGNLPELAAGLRRIEDKGRTLTSFKAALKAGFGKLASISIDYGVLEKTPNAAVVAGAFEWDDVGSWRAVERYAPRDTSGNSVLGRHAGLDTADCILVGRERLIATVGVKDLVVVATEDVVLVCHRDQTERVKELVDRLAAEKRTEYL
jgi:mannose-1-phosphate guanylyltransferase